MKFQSVQPELAFVALLIIGAVEFSLGQLPITKRRREAFVVLSVLGAALMIAAVPFRYSGNNVAMLWLIGGEALLMAGVLVRRSDFSPVGSVRRNAGWAAPGLVSISANSWRSREDTERTCFAAWRHVRAVCNRVLSQRASRWEAVETVLC